MLYDGRPLYRGIDPPQYPNRFLLEVMFVLMCPIVLFVAIMVFGYSEVFYLKESGALEISVSLGP